MLPAVTGADGATATPLVSPFGVSWGVAGAPADSPKWRRVSLEVWDEAASSPLDQRQPSTGSGTYQEGAAALVAANF
jgi:hypothetical protein